MRPGHFPSGICARLHFDEARCMGGGMKLPLRLSTPWPWLLALFSAIVFAGPSSGQDAPAKAKSVFDSGERSLEKEFVLREMLDAFFGSVQAGELETAFKELLKDSKIGQSKALVDNLITKTKRIGDTFGKMEGWEMIRAERVGARLIRISYLGYPEDLPLRWQFYCYRGRDKWQIVDISVSDNLGELFGDPPSDKEATDE